MTTPIATPEQKRQVAERLALLEADREDLKRQRQICAEDIERCNRELASPSSGEHASIVRDQKRDSGMAIQEIDRALSRVARQTSALNYFTKSSIPDYFMKAAETILPRADFEKVKAAAYDLRSEAAAIFITESNQQP